MGQRQEEPSKIMPSAERNGTFGYMKLRGGVLYTFGHLFSGNVCTCQKMPLTNQKLEDLISRIEFTALRSTNYELFSIQYTGSNIGRNIYIQASGVMFITDCRRSCEEEPNPISNSRSICSQDLEHETCETNR